MPLFLKRWKNKLLDIRDEVMSLIDEYRIARRKHRSLE